MGKQAQALKRGENSWRPAKQKGVERGINKMTFTDLHSPVWDHQPNVPSNITHQQFKIIGKNTNIECIAIM